MGVEKRKDRRKSTRYSAWAHDGEIPYGCVVADISATGARLEVDNPKDLPETFTLLLAGHGRERRHCRVMWRSERQVGVVFEANATKASPTLRQTIPA